MKPSKIASLLTDSLKNATLIEIHRPGVEMYPLVGVVKGMDKWILIASVNYQFQAAGFDIVRLRDIKFVRTPETTHIIHRVAQQQGTHLEREPAVKFSLSSTRDLAHSVFDANVFAGVYTYNHKTGREVDAYPGRIHEIRNRILALHRLTGRGVWDKSPLTLPFSEIARFSFDSVRLRLMEEHAEEHPGGPSTVVDWTMDLPALLGVDVEPDASGASGDNTTTNNEAVGTTPAHGSQAGTADRAPEAPLDPRDDFLGGLR